ncbi:MAG: hypothetical protein ACMXYG_04445 [Candidatus Woesearchaeota archaeon]
MKKILSLGLVLLASDTFSSQIDISEIESRIFNYRLAVEQRIVEVEDHITKMLEYNQNFSNATNLLYSNYNIDRSFQIVSDLERKLVGNDFSDARLLLSKVRSFIGEINDARIVSSNEVRIINSYKRRFDNANSLFGQGKVLESYEALRTVSGLIDSATILYNRDDFLALEVLVKERLNTVSGTIERLERDRNQLRTNLERHSTTINRYKARGFQLNSNDRYYPGYSIFEDLLRIESEIKSYSIDDPDLLRHSQTMISDIDFLVNRLGNDVTANFRERLRQVKLLIRSDIRDNYQKASEDSRLVGEQTRNFIQSELYQRVYGGR